MDAIDVTAREEICAEFVLPAVWIKMNVATTCSPRKDIHVDAVRCGRSYNHSFDWNDAARELLLILRDFINGKFTLGPKKKGRG